MKKTKKHGKAMCALFKQYRSGTRLSSFGLNKVLAYFENIPDEFKQGSYKALEKELKKRGISNEI
jgi:hypothetical protein|tara:strand:- start:1814 stop:2008 length:195 start_codon:yes stop_codon:yes gene_type:complete